MMTTHPLADAYVTLLDLALRQARALDQADLEAFEALSAERERAFAGLTALEPAAASLGPEERRAIASVIERILALDAAMQGTIATLQAEAREELSGLQTGMAALSSYGAELRGEALFIDRSG